MKKVERAPWWCLDCHCLMEYQGADDFFKCPECGVEVWFSTDFHKGDDVTDLMGDMLADHEGRKLDALPAGQANPKKSAGGSGKGRKKQTGTFTPWYRRGLQ